MDKDKFVKRYPHVYHMAEEGTWSSIKKHGLMSTTAVLDFHQLTGTDRKRYEETHRPEKCTVGVGKTAIVLRDQKPMETNRLAGALQNGVTAAQWYKWLNGRAFFWAEEKRLLQLLKARPYRKLKHDVLTLDTEKLVNDYEQAIWLCHMNSGNTFPMPFPRDHSTFKRIADYPVTATGRPTKVVVEVVVDYAVKNIKKYVVEVRQMQGESVLQQIPL